MWLARVGPSTPEPCTAVFEWLLVLTRPAESIPRGRAALLAIAAGLVRAAAVRRWHRDSWRLSEAPWMRWAYPRSVLLCAPDARRR